MQSSGATAGLRGIDSVNGAVAWASGTGGAILRTTDGGAHWQHCASPDTTLDFRGIQGFDANTAVVMASGPGAQSRLYKTTDGCASWKLLFANPDAPDGFFDSFWFNGPHGMVLGDPVRGRFVVFLTSNRGRDWKRDEFAGLELGQRTLAAFAASNSAVAIGNALFVRGFATGGKSGAVFFSRPFTEQDEQHGLLDRTLHKKQAWTASPIPIASGSDSAGAFSVAYRYPVTVGACPDCGFDENSVFIAVGGDYTKPNEATRTAAFSTDGGWTWTASSTPPHGYRSAVQYSTALSAWIAAGPNGSDVSRDDGRTWQPLDNGNWNALSLPYVVGPDGRIARLNLTALPKP